MKKLLTLAAAGLLGVGAYAQTDAAIDLSTVFVAEDRASWIISGCSQANSFNDDGFAEIKDGNNSTYWHSDYNNVDNYSTECPHYFVVDRGENAASDPIDGFGYLPRQEAGNGHVTAYRLYVLDNIDGLNTVPAGSTPAHINEKSHSSLTTFLQGKTPTKQGTFDIVQSNLSTHGLRQVLFDDRQSGRYILFVIDNVSSNEEGKHANCAEFYLYDISEVATRVTLTFKRNNEDSNPFVLKSVAMLSQSFPTYDCFTCTSTGMVSNDNTAAEYVLNQGTLFYLYNERKGTYVRGNADNNNDLRQEKTHNPGSEAEFMMIPCGDDNDAFAIYYPAADKFVGNIVNSQTTTPLVNFTFSPQKYYTGKQDAPANYMSWIGNSLSKGESHNYFNDLGTWGVCGYKWNDAGSKWVIVTNLEQFNENWQLRNDLLAALPNYDAMLTLLGEEDTEGLKTWAENYDFGGDVNVPVTPENQEKIDKIMNITLRADIEIAKLRGNKLASLDFITEAGKTAWNASLSQLDGAEASEATLTSLNDAITTLGKATKDTYLKFQSGKPECDVDYLGANIGQGNALNPAPHRWAGGEDCRIWKLCSADGVGFHLFNEYTNKYMKHPAAGGNATFVSDVAEASVYLIDVYDHENGMYGLRTFDEGVPADGAYLLSDGNNYLQRGTAKNVSSWYISQVTEDEAANEHLAGAKFYYDQFIGEELGKYTANQEAIDAAGVTTSASAEEKRAAATTLFSAPAQFTLNMPKAGTYLKFKGAHNVGTLVDLVVLFYNTEHGTGGSGSARMTVDKNHPNANFSDKASIFYYDGQHLLNYSTGYYLYNDANSYPCFITSTDMGEGGQGNLPLTIGIVPGASQYGTYQINYTGRDNNPYSMKINGTSSAYWFADRDALASGSDINSVSSSEVFGNWFVSQVNELPVAIHADGYGSFIAPVAVSFNVDIPVYKGSVNGSVLTFAQVEAGTDIAPNTPVIIKGTPSSTVNATINYGYVAPDAPAALATEESTIRLGGSHIAANQVAETNLSTFAKTGVDATFTDDNNVTLNKVTEGSVIPVNTLLLTLHNDSKLIADGGATATVNLTKENVTTGISAIEFRNLDGTREIYDLQGRRVQRASKGLYIINGVKTLVK